MATRQRNRDINLIVLEAITALALAPQNFSSPVIRRRLVDFPKFKGLKIPEMRTVQRVVREIRGKLGPLDRPFEWHRLKEYEDLPWEASGFLLQMWAYVKELSGDLEWGLQYPTPLPPPTVRQAQWWWRVHLAAPDQDNMFVWMWAKELWRCDLLKDVLGKTVDVSGIEAYLAYGEWVGSEHRTAYVQAIKDGRIPPLPSVVGDHALSEELRGDPDLGDFFPKPGPRIFEKPDFFPELEADQIQRMEEVEQ